MSLATVPSDNHPRPTLGRRAYSFDEIRVDVAARATLAYPDQVIPLSRLHATEAGMVEVLGVGVLALSDWSRRQLSRMLGIRWERWFAEALVSPAERADEINRRLSRYGQEAKIRACRYADGETGDGILRAFLGPRYTPIDDARVFDRLAHVLGSRVEEFRFVRADRSDEGSTYVAVAAEDLDLGHETPDPHRPAFAIANSEVGARALSIVEWFWRLICSNGLGGWVAKKLFYRVHRETEDESIDRDLAYAISLLPERWAAGAAALKAARAQVVTNPEDALRALLAGDPDARRHTDTVLTAYRLEPEPTRFGLLQAVTRAAQGLTVGSRYALETFAGRMLRAPNGAAS